MIINQVQYRATKAHLRQFEEAATALEGKTDARSTGSSSTPSAPRPADLRGEIEEYEQFRGSSGLDDEASASAGRFDRGYSQS